MDSILMLVSDPNTRWVLAACVLLGLSSGVLGCFALLRKHSLMGDAVAHAALPGICIAFMLYGTKSILLFMIGAIISGLIASSCITYITKNSRIKEDTALGLVLTVFFGFGIVLMTIIQQSAQGNQSGMDSFLFGKAASLVGVDVQVMMVVASILLIVCWLLFKEFKLLSFDPGFGRGLGMPMGVLNTVLMLLIVIAVVIGLQAVGVVLMAAMLITPAIAARYWTERLDLMIILAGVFGGLSGVLGTYVSTLTSNMPTGPVIVLAATAMFFISLIFAPRRGLLMKMLRLTRLRSQVARENLLQSLYDLEEKGQQNSAGSPDGHTLEQLLAWRPISPRTAASTLRHLVQTGLVREVSQGYRLTDRGLETAYKLTLNQRMWDIFLMYESKLGGYKFNRDVQGDLAAELSPDTLEEIRRLLLVHQLQPTLRYEGGGSS